jgi:hypothetical protein
MKMMFKAGACGIGCKIPVFVYTPCFNEDGLDGDSDEKGFHWSCSNTIGWLRRTSSGFMTDSLVATSRVALLKRTVPTVYKFRTSEKFSSTASSRKNPRIRLSRDRTMK